MSTPVKKYSQRALGDLAKRLFLKQPVKQQQPPKYPERKPVPEEVLRKGRAIQLMIAGVVIMAFPSVELYRRLVLGEERKMRTGEILKDGSIRVFSEEEKLYRDRNHWLIKTFGDK